MKEIQSIIRAIPNDGGWWKKEGERTFNDVADKMINKGFSIEETKNILETLYWTVAEQFGGC